MCYCKLSPTFNYQTPDRVLKLGIGYSTEVKVLAYKSGGCGFESTNCVKVYRMGRNRLNKHRMNIESGI